MEGMGTMKVKVGNLKKIFVDDSALGTAGCMACLPIGGAASGILGGIVTAIFGGIIGITSAVPVILGSCCANLIPFGGCVCGNCATCLPCAWGIDAIEVLSCASIGGVLGGSVGGISLGGLGGIISGICGGVAGILGDIGGVITAIFASAGFNVSEMTSLFNF